MASKKGRQRSDVAPFVKKLWDALSPDIKEDERLLLWKPDGKSFIIKDERRLVEEVLDNIAPSSFHRNLNLYDFAREGNVVKHKESYFIRDQTDDLKLLKRIRMKKDSRQSNADTVSGSSGYNSPEGCSSQSARQVRLLPWDEYGIMLMDPMSGPVQGETPFKIRLNSSSVEFEHLEAIFDGIPGSGRVVHHGGNIWLGLSPKGNEPEPVQVVFKTPNGFEIGTACFTYEVYNLDDHNLCSTDQRPFNSGMDEHQGNSGTDNFVKDGAVVYHKDFHFSRDQTEESLRDIGMNKTGPVLFSDTMSSQPSPAPLAIQPRVVPALDIAAGFTQSIQNDSFQDSKRGDGKEQQVPNHLLKFCCAESDEPDDPLSELTKLSLEDGKVSEEALELLARKNGHREPLARRLGFDSGEEYGFHLDKSGNNAEQARSMLFRWKQVLWEALQVPWEALQVSWEALQVPLRNRTVTRAGLVHGMQQGDWE